MMPESQKIPITLLGDDNYLSWFVDIRAYLRRHGYWTYTQTPPRDSDDLSKYESTADLITPTLTQPVKQWLTEKEFNNGYLLFTRLKELL